MDHGGCTGTLVDGWRRLLSWRYISPRRWTRASGGVFVDGLLSGAERKTPWMLAEEVGPDPPYHPVAVQRRTAWNRIEAERSNPDK